MSDEAAPYLPTLDDLRAAAAAQGGPPSEVVTAEPASVAAIAAIVLAGAVVRRQVWADEVEMSETLFERYPRGEAPTPTRFAEASYQLVDEAHPARTERCSSCFLTSGRVQCIACYGSGQTDGARCEGCDGKGSLPCGVCEGSGKIVRAGVIHVNDHAADIRQSFLPELPRGLVPPLEAFLSTLRDLPAALRFELQPTVVGSAYRGAATVRDPDFHGHDFGAALGAAVFASTNLSRYGNVVLSAVQAFAWPLLHVRFDAGGRPRDFLVLRDERGARQWLEASPAAGPPATVG